MVNQYQEEGLRKTALAFRRLLDSSDVFSELRCTDSRLDEAIVYGLRMQVQRENIALSLPTVPYAVFKEGTKNLDGLLRVASAPMDRFFKHDFADVEGMLDFPGEYQLSEIVRDPYLNVMMVDPKVRGFIAGSTAYAEEKGAFSGWCFDDHLPLSAVNNVLPAKLVLEYGDLQGIKYLEKYFIEILKICSPYTPPRM